jgi:hypothetical protein
MVVEATKNVVEKTVVEVVVVVVKPEIVVLVKDVNDSVFIPVVCNVVVLNDVETWVVEVVVVIGVVVKIELTEVNVDVETVTTPTVKTPTPVSPVFPLTKTLYVPGEIGRERSATWKDAATFPFVIEQMPVNALMSPVGVLLIVHEVSEALKPDPVTVTNVPPTPV